MLQHYELIEIEEISELPYDGIVYDLEVENDHSYNINDVIVHNSSCITKNKTGFHRPMVTTIIECAEAAMVPIIADGGIKEHGDIAKAIACGATMVMAGSLFSGYDESAGDILEINGHKYKEYYGSASEFNKSRQQHIEGKRILVDYKGSMVRLLDELQEDLQSSISYAGGSDLTALHQGLLLRVK